MLTDKQLVQSCNNSIMTAFFVWLLQLLSHTFVEFCFKVPFTNENYQKATQVWCTASRGEPCYNDTKSNFDIAMSTSDTSYEHVFITCQYWQETF